MSNYSVGQDFDKAEFDPLFCGLVVALIISREKEGYGIGKLMFTEQPAALKQYMQRMDRSRDIRHM
jgi:hypothetical protein